MIEHTVNAALEEAKRFINRVDELNENSTRLLGSNELIYANQKYTAAVKRSSMDLTRALADMRNTQ